MNPDINAPVFQFQDTDLFYATLLKATQIDTPLGRMIAIADEKSLYLLEFLNQKRVERAIKRINQQGLGIIWGDTLVLESIRIELNAYFNGTLRIFKTSYQALGTPFQQHVWSALTRIPFGETRSYLEQATSLGKPTSYRAVANANGANPLAIIIPCHRIIAHDGTLGGYGGGLAAKAWLLKHEQEHN